MANKYSRYMEQLVYMLREFEVGLRDDTTEISALARVLFTKDGHYLFDVMDEFYRTYKYLIIPGAGMSAHIQTTVRPITFVPCT